MVEATESLVPEVGRPGAEAALIRAEAAAQLAETPTWASEEKKAPGWALEDRAADLERKAALVDLQVEPGLYGALGIDGLPGSRYGDLGLWLARDPV